MIDTNVYNFLSTLERIVWDWLSKRKIPFATQQKMFGVMELGSAIIDFILVERNIVIRTHGAYWHSGLIPEARDLIGREKLIEAGYIVVDCFEDDLLRRLDFTLEKAIIGEEMIR